MYKYGDLGAGGPQGIAAADAVTTLSGKLL